MNRARRRPGSGLFRLSTVLLALVLLGGGAVALALAGLVLILLAGGLWPRANSEPAGDTLEPGATVAAP